MPIEIKITNTETSELNNSSPANPLQPNEQTSADDSKVSGKKDPAKGMILNFLKNQSITWAKAGVQSYTKYTGQGMLQNQIDTGLQVVSDVGTIIAGGVSGGGVGAGIAIAMISLNYGMKVFNQHMDLSIQNRGLSFVRQSQGEIVSNGGRYGA